MKFNEMLWDVGTYTLVITSAALGGVFAMQQEWLLTGIDIAIAVCMQGVGLLRYIDSKITNTQLKITNANIEAELNRIKTAYDIAMQGLLENVQALDEAKKIIAENMVENENIVPI